MSLAKRPYVGSPKYTKSKVRERVRHHGTPMRCGIDASVGRKQDDISRRGSVNGQHDQTAAFRRKRGTSTGAGILDVVEKHNAGRGQVCFLTADVSPVRDPDRMCLKRGVERRIVDRFQC
jgi:hypothetical protein